MMRIRIQVNANEPFTDLSIRRLSPDAPEEGDMCKYHVEDIILWKSKLESHIGFIEYPFGDGNGLAIEALKLLKD